MIELLEVQKVLKAPKNQYNNFGKYAYRSCEDILEAVKPLCIEKGLVLIISDDIINIGNRYYIKAIASVTKGDKTISACGIAREAENQKGMNDSQLTGSTSSYARKYALNGLFCIDDSKDSDSTNKHGKEKQTTNNTKPTTTNENIIGEINNSSLPQERKETLIRQLNNKPESAKEAFIGFIKQEIKKNETNQ